MANLAIDRLGLGGDADRSLFLPLASLGQELAHRVGPLNLWTAVLLAGALTVDKLVGLRTRASWRIALYAPVLLRVAMPLDWSLRPASAPRVEMIFEPLLARANDATFDASFGSGSSWFAFAAVVYLAVAAVLAIRLVVADARLDRALGDALRVSDRDFGVPFPVFEHAHLGPMVVGVWEPRIVVPVALLSPGQERALSCVLRHESAHLRRRDPWLMLAMHVCTVVAWPVLPVWIAMRRVRHLMELACDESALSGCDMTERHHYGHTLLDLAERHAPGDAPPFAGELHFGSTLRARIEALASQRHWPLALQAIVVPTIAALLFVACGSSTTGMRTGAPGEAANSGDRGPRGYGYEFATDTVAKVSAAAAPPPELRPLAEFGRLRPEAIEDVVRIHFGATLTCYEQGRRANPALAGVVKVRFVIKEDGFVRDAFDDRSTLADQEVIRCIVADFKTRHFPESHDGDVTVVYPIQLGT